MRRAQGTVAVRRFLLQPASLRRFASLLRFRSDVLASAASLSQPSPRFGSRDTFRPLLRTSFDGQPAQVAPVPSLPLASTTGFARRPRGPSLRWTGRLRSACSPCLSSRIACGGQGAPPSGETPCPPRPFCALVAGSLCAFCAFRASARILHAGGLPTGERAVFGLWARRTAGRVEARAVGAEEQG